VAKLVPTNIARMRVQQHNRPVLPFHLACPPLDARLLAGKCLLTGFGSSIHVGTRIEGVVQQGKDTPTSQWFPHQFSFARALPEPIWEAKVVEGKVLHDGQC